MIKRVSGEEARIKHISYLRSWVLVHCKCAEENRKTRKPLSLIGYVNREKLFSKDAREA